MNAHLDSLAQQGWTEYSTFMAIALIVGVVVVVVGKWLIERIRK